MKLKLNNKGVSLAMTIGLLLLLVAITATINELVIRALRASHQIEASDKAYFAAEGGIEDALYELSAHSAGYETADLTHKTVRTSNFTETVTWNNRWEIKSKNLNLCENNLAQWGDFKPSYCGKLYENQKLVLNLFSDNANSLGVKAEGINPNSKDIERLTINSFKLTIRIPAEVLKANSSAFSGLQPLNIDNDNDYNGVFDTGLNEDGHPDFDFLAKPCPYSNGISVNDNDCDGREDEDSAEDPVLLWKLDDHAGYSFEPLRGCKTDPAPGAVLCEKDFSLSDGDLSASLTESDMGMDQNGTPMTMAEFIASVPSDRELGLELLTVAPMQAVDSTIKKKIPIPYLEYGIEYAAGGSVLPSTFFSLKSDGFYKDFKQSITTKIVPRAATKLLDLTIIQQ